MKKSSLLILSFFMAFFAVSAFAGNGGANEFNALEQQLLGWSQGGLGRVIAISAFLIGAGTGVAKGSAIPPIVGIVLALMLFYGPTIISGVLTATV